MRSMLRTQWEWEFMGTKWKRHENTLGTYKSNTLTIPQKKKSLRRWMHTASPYYYLQEYFLPTCVLCHFWPRLMWEASTMGEYMNCFNTMGKSLWLANQQQPFWCTVRLSITESCKLKPHGPAMVSDIL